jgi:hypothetical protein
VRTELREHLEGRIDANRYDDGISPIHIAQVGRESARYHTLVDRCIEK